MSRRSRGHLITGPRIFFLGMTASNVAIFVFHVALSRIVGPAAYGALGAVLSLSVVLNVGTGAIQVAITREVAGSPAGTGLNPSRLLRRGSVLSIVAGSVTILLSPLLVRYLHLTSPVAVVFLGIYVAAIVVGLVPKGVLLGEHDFYPVALALAVGAGIRLVIGVALSLITKDAAGGIAGAAVGEVFTTVIVTRALLSRRAPSTTERPLSVPLGPLSMTIASYAGLWLLTGADTFLARHYLPAIESGLYVAASTAGSIALFLPYNVTMSAFPRMAELAAEGRGNIRDVLGPFVNVLLMTISATAVLCLVPGLIIEVLFGAAYKSAVSTLQLLAISNGSLGVVGFLLHHQLAHHRRTVLLPWISLIVLVVGAGHMNGRNGIATLALAATGSLLVVMLTVSARVAYQVRGYKGGEPTVDVGPQIMEKFN